MSEAIEALLVGDPAVPAAGGVHGPRADLDARDLRGGRGRLPAASGTGTRCARSPGSRSRPRCLDDSNPPFYKWFADGELNVSYNCLDRHIAERRRRQDRANLDRRAGRRARASPTGAARRGGAVRQRAEGAGRASAATASRSTWAWCRSCRSRCWRARASARRTRSCSAVSRRRPLADRIDDAACKVLITCDGAWRRGQIVPLKDMAPTRRSRNCPSIEHVLVVRRTEKRSPWIEGRDVWWHDVVAAAAD